MVFRFIVVSSLNVLMMLKVIENKRLELSKTILVENKIPFACDDLKELRNRPQNVSAAKIDDNTNNILNCCFFHNKFHFATSKQISM